MHKGRQLGEAFFGYNTGMAYTSVLFMREAAARECEGAREPECFRDLNLDSFVESLTTGMDEYSLAPFFYAQPGDSATVAYRQQVFKDLERAKTLAGVKRFAIGERRLRDLAAKASRLHHSIQKDRWFLDVVDHYCRVVGELRDDLMAAELGSRGMTAMRDHLVNYTASPAFIALRDGAAEARSALATVRYCVHIRNKTIRVQKYDGEEDYVAEIERIFGKFRRDPGREYLSETSGTFAMSSVEEKIVEQVAALFPEVFERLHAFRESHEPYADPTIATFDREVQFYLAYRDYIDPLRRQDLRFCYPSVSPALKEELSVGGFDIVLASALAKGGARVVTNDYRLDGPERVLVVTGPNQGGKTTFARTFGQLHYLAKIGLPVPGSQARLLFCDAVFTHFEREERFESLRGKLQDDLVRIRSILDRATGRSVVILNEIFTSTSLTDAVFLSGEVLSRIMKADALCACVTFIDELARMNEKTVSVMSGLSPDDPELRTFKILRRPPDGLAHALAIALRHRLGSDDILARIRP
jgi:DNA mismatch repair protein MutS